VDRSFRLRLFGISMLRNEADIVEAFVRHNLRVLDGIVVIDHDATDGTAEILAQLRAEGMPLRVIVDTAAGFFQAERLTALARKVLSEDAADFVFLLDADEFMHVESRERLESALRDLPRAAHGLSRWGTYVPESFDSALGPGHFRWRREFDDGSPGKAFVGRSLLERTSQYVVSGNHLIDDPSSPRPPPHVRLRAKELTIAHVPVRSLRQLQKKVVIGYLAHLATRPTNDAQASHWRELYREFRDGPEMPSSRLREIACNYGLPRDKWQSSDRVKLVDDPVRVDLEQRYASSAAPDALRLLMRFTESLLRPANR
jgi:glycosyl transferase family 2